MTSVSHRLHGTAGALAAVLVLGLGGRAQAQDHEGHMHEASPAQDAHPGVEMPMEHEHSMAGVLGLPEQRVGSGTSWQPDSTPMYAWQTMAHGWMLMLHTNVLFGYDAQGGDRGDGELFSANWIMGMARHELGGGELAFRAMLSLEPATMGEDGYPLLLQTGETLDGQPLHDRQHPHDLFMEVAAMYRHALGDALGLELYVAPAGEPALGPTAFPHRFSSLANPFAPIGHHWQDSTHISFGVITAGVFTRQLKLEGSWFNGREPDEQRWDLDLRAPDSAAARLSFNPTSDLSAQVSYGYLKSPEALEPDESLRRTTASVTWNHRMGSSHDLALVGVLGRNDPEHGPSTSSALVEGALQLYRQHTVFTRAELLTKTGKELVLPDTMADDRFAVGALSLGVDHDFMPSGAVVPTLGVVGSVDVVDAELEPFYGTRTPVSVMVFVGLHAPQVSPSM